MNLREVILSANDCPLQSVNVPEWGVDIFLRPLNGRNRAKLVKMAGKEESLYGFALVASAADEAGNALFTEADIPKLEEKNGAVLDRLGRLIVEMNGLGGNAVDEKKVD